MNYLGVQYLGETRGCVKQYELYNIMIDTYKDNEGTMWLVRVFDSFTNKYLGIVISYSANEWRFKMNMDIAS